MTLPVDVLVVGGGITGLAAAHRLTRRGGIRWLLVERDPRLGGKITTDRRDGYVIEGGPDCFLGAKRPGMEFCQDLGIHDRLIGTSPDFRRTYVKRDGLLRQLPAGITGLVPSQLGPLLTSSVLSLGGRLRAAMELVIPARRGQAEESVAQFVTRRFGREAYDWLVEPLLSGIFAGDGNALSLTAAFPQLAELEQRHGSILRAMLAGSRTGHRSSGPGTSIQGFVTLPGGLAELVDTVTRQVPSESVRLGVGVEGLRPTDGGFQARLDDGTMVRTGAVILALPAFAAADLLYGLDPALAARLREIPFVSTMTVSVAFPAADVAGPLDGYGFVSPRAGGGPIVACTWTSNKFPARAPEGRVLLRFFLGRAGDEAIVAASSDTIMHVIRQELSAVLGIMAAPALWKLYRWPRGIPQYTLGHRQRVTAIEAAAERHGRLALAGASYHGIGIPDCVASGRSAVDRVLARPNVAAA